MKNVYWLLAALAAALILRANLPDGDRLEMSPDASPAIKAAASVMMVTGVLRVTNQTDWLVFKTGTLGERFVVLLPFMDGWGVL